MQTNPILAWPQANESELRAAYLDVESQVEISQVHVEHFRVIPVTAFPDDARFLRVDKEKAVSFITQFKTHCFSQTVTNTITNKTYMA